MMCRYGKAGPLDDIERWPLDLLHRRFDALKRVLDHESKAVKNG